MTLNGSKTAGELALLLEETTLITGDLVRAPRGGSLDHLPEAKLSDPSAALRSLQRLATFEKVQTVLPGDGWSVFQLGAQALRDLAKRIETGGR